MKLCRRLNLNVLFVIFLFFLSNPALAKDWFVALNGNDGWNITGSIDDPFASINRALWQGYAGSGDTIHVRGGTYTLTTPVEVWRGGSLGYPLIIRPYLKEKVIFNGSNIFSSFPHIFGIGSSHIVIDGFDIGSSRDGCIDIWANSDAGAIENVVIRNNVIHDCFKAGIFMGHALYQDTTGVRNIVIANNTLYHNVQENKARNSNFGWSPALGILYSQDVLIYGNHVYENYGEGIDIIRSRRANVIRNMVHDNFSVNLYIDGGTETRHEANLVYSTGNKEYYRNYGSFGYLPATGIQIANEKCVSNSNNFCWDNPIISSDNVIVNNIFIANNNALNYGNYDGIGGNIESGGLKNLQFAFNTVYGATKAVLQIQKGTGHTNSEIANNIFRQIGDVPQTDIDISGNISGNIIFDHNLWFGGFLPQPEARHLSDLLEDPAFVKPGGYVAANYILSPISPAIVIGQTMASVGQDYCGRLRQNPPSLGAFDSPIVVAALYDLTLPSLLAGVTDKGMVFYTADLGSWINVPGQLSQLQEGDFDGDGRADFAGLTDAGQIFYTNRCVWIHIPGTLNQLRIGDFNGDGKADLAGLTAAGNIYYTTNLSTWNYIPGVLAKLVAGDFNGDGKADLAGLTNAGNIYYTTNRSTWNYIPGVLNKLVAGDINGDGKTDLAGLTSAGNIYYTTDLASWHYIPGVLAKLVVGDLNGDGRADLAGLTGTGNIYYTTNLIAWNYIPGVLNKLVAGDINGDGKTDLAGLTASGLIFYTTNLSNWTNIPGQLNRLAGDN